MIRYLFHSLCIAVVLCVLPGCFLLGTYPPGFDYAVKLEEPPTQLRDFAERFPEAEAPSFYRSEGHHEGLIDSRTVYGYRVHFRLDDRWYVADYDRAGTFEKVEPSEADFSPRY